MVCLALFGDTANGIYVGHLEQEAEHTAQARLCANHVGIIICCQFTAITVGPQEASQSSREHQEVQYYQVSTDGKPDTVRPAEQFPDDVSAVLPASQGIQQCCKFSSVDGADCLHFSNIPMSTSLCVRIQNQSLDRYALVHENWVPSFVCR